VVGSLLVYALVLASVAKYHSWPFAGYPTFEDATLAPEAQVLFVEAERPGGGAANRDVLLDRLLPRMSSERYHALMLRILTLEDQSELRRRLSALWCTALRERPDLSNLQHVTFHVAVVSTRPEHWGKSPIGKRRLADLPEVVCPAAAPT
jgi:hypothetical protein